MLISKILIICFFMINSMFCFSQSGRFIQSGVIEYEKKVNMFAILKRSARENTSGYAKQRFESYLNSQAQFITFKSELKFLNNETVFKPLIDQQVTAVNFSHNPMVSQNNLIYSDLESGKSTSQKDIFEEKVLFTNNIRKIKWRLTNETRTIAGYLCRRANAIILDSIYVVAFYSDQIPTCGGPESFTGLPGMILGVVLPYENITWFAKSILEKSIPVSEIKVPLKGKPVNADQLRILIDKVAKASEELSQSVEKAFSL